MLHYDRIDVSEGIDINKTNASKQCDICHYWYCIITGISKIEALNLMQNNDLTEKRGIL